MPEGGLYAAFVNSTEALALIDDVDVTEALKVTVQMWRLFTPAPHLNHTYVLTHIAQPHVCQGCALQVQVPGAVMFISACDIPKAGQNTAFDDVLFAEHKVEYQGQRIGLMLGTSQVNPSPIWCLISFGKRAATCAKGFQYQTTICWT